MSYAAFNTAESAQAYADQCQQYLVNTIGQSYIAPRWSTVAQGTDGRYYVSVLQAFPPPTDEIVVNIPLPQGAD